MQLSSPTLRKNVIYGSLAIVFLVSIVAYLLREDLFGSEESGGVALPIPAVSGVPVPSVDQEFFSRPDVATLRRLAEPPVPAPATVKSAPFVPPPKDRVGGAQSFVETMTPASLPPEQGEGSAASLPPEAAAFVQ